MNSNQEKEYKKMKKLYDELHEKAVIQRAELTKTESQMDSIRKKMDLLKGSSDEELENQELKLSDVPARPTSFLDETSELTFNVPSDSTNLNLHPDTIGNVNGQYKVLKRNLPEAKAILCSTNYVFISFRHNLILALPKLQMNNIIAELKIYLNDIKTYMLKDETTWDGPHFPTIFKLLSKISLNIFGATFLTNRTWSSEARSPNSKIVKTKFKEQDRNILLRIFGYLKEVKHDDIKETAEERTLALKDSTAYDLMSKVLHKFKPEGKTPVSASVVLII